MNITDNITRISCMTSKIGCKMNFSGYRMSRIGCGTIILVAEQAG